MTGAGLRQALSVLVFICVFKCASGAKVACEGPDCKKAEIKALTDEIIKQDVPNVDLISRAARLDADIAHLLKLMVRTDEGWEWDPEEIELERIRRRRRAPAIVGFLIVAVVGQFALIKWMRTHRKSYEIATLLAFWLVPAVMCTIYETRSFVTIWLGFSFISAILALKALQMPMAKSTPRLVYGWFFFLWSISGLLVFTGTMLAIPVIGYILGDEHDWETWMLAPFTLIFYGLYFGILGKDLAEVCADLIVSRLVSIPKRQTLEQGSQDESCYMCANNIRSSSWSNTLSCGHVFHTFCIRGWSMVGKRNVCPYCKEKVDVADIAIRPWERPGVLYSCILGWMRWTIAWVPLVIHLANDFADLFDDPEDFFEEVPASL